MKFGGKKVSDPDMTFFTSRVKPGVFLVRVKDNCNGYHAICVDNRKSVGYVYDSAEEYAMRLCDDSIRLCVGDDNQYLGMSDLREIVVLKSNGKGRKRPSRTERKNKKKIMK